MDTRTSKVNAASHEELVAHLVRSMQRQGLTIEAANAPGYRKPGHVKSGRGRSRFRPDVVALDGRRTIFGVAKSGAEASSGDVRDQLEAFASKCRTVVICVPEKAADGLVRSSDTPSWRKLRLLRHPSTQWQDMPRTPRAMTRPAFAPAGVSVVIHPA